jgi:hypothetical protein
VILRERLAREPAELVVARGERGPEGDEELDRVVLVELLHALGLAPPFSPRLVVRLEMPSAWSYEHAVGRQLEALEVRTDEPRLLATEVRELIVVARDGGRLAVPHEQDARAHQDLNIAIRRSTTGTSPNQK